MDALNNPSSRFTTVLTGGAITSVLTLRDTMTGGPKTLTFGVDHDKVMNVRSFLHVHSDIGQHNDLQDKQWAKHLVSILNNNFKLRLGFGGNAQDFGSPTPTCMEEVFLTEDVANLVMIAYEDSVKNLSFFDDMELVSKYFLPTTDVRGVFQNNNLI